MLRLHDWAPSPFCHKVRAVLAYKGLAYERVLATRAGMQALAARGTGGKLPVLEMDGALISDSTDIALAIDRAHPEPRLIPSGVRDSALCRALEDWADEAIYFNALHYHWRDPGGRDQTKAYFTSLGPEVEPMFEPMATATLAQLEGHGTARRSDAAIRQDTATQIETAANLVSKHGFLLADRPYLCDFALMGQLVYLSRTPVGAQLLASHEGLARYLRMMKTAGR